MSDGAAGVRSQGDRNEPRGDRSGATARRAAGGARGVPRVARSLVAGVLTRRAHRELVHVGHADQDGARVEQALRAGRGVRRAVALQDAAPEGDNISTAAE